MIEPAGADGKRTQLREYTAGSVTPTRTRDLRYAGGAIAEERVTDAAHPSGAVVRAYTADESGRIVSVAVAAGEPGAGTYLVAWSPRGDALSVSELDPATGTATVANRYAYATWGAPSTTLLNGYPDLGFRYLWSGASDVQWDDAAGEALYYMHARTYSPALGRFLQPDPARAGGSLYAYAGNSPVTKSDPSGLFWYRVQPGDNLRNLATRFLGSANQIQLLVATNMGRIPRRRSTVQVGQCIWIPKGLRSYEAHYWLSHACSESTWSDVTSMWPPELRGPAYLACRLQSGYQRVGKVFGGALVVVGGVVMVGVGLGIAAAGVGVGIAEVVSIGGIPIVLLTGGSLVAYGIVSGGAGVAVIAAGFGIAGSGLC